LAQALMFLGRAVKGTKLKQDVLMFGRLALSLWEPKDFGLSVQGATTKLKRLPYKLYSF
jgi:hypothetical protein